MNNKPVSGSEKPKFQDVWNDIQARMGKKPEPERKIKKTLDKDDFLKIMITQMKNQDPTKPFEADKLASEIAQIATVEQLMNVNKLIEKMGNQDKPLEKMQMTSLIGKTVTVDRSRFIHKEGTNEKLSFVLPRSASQVKVNLIDGEGQVIFTKELGEMDKGPQSFVWDGKNTQLLTAPAGSYGLKIEAQDLGGRPMNTDPQGKNRVIGVSYDGPEPVLLVGTANSYERVTMDRVLMIEESGLPSRAPAVQAPRPNPEEGMKLSEMPDHIKKKLAKFEIQHEQAKQARMKEEGPGVNQDLPKTPKKVSPEKPVEKGFPNGLGGVPGQPMAQNEEKKL